MPLRMSAIPQTESWLSKNCRFKAEGTPIRKAVTVAKDSARCFLMPNSVSVCDSRNSMEIIEDKAAIENARKKIALKKEERRLA